MPRVNYIISIHLSTDIIIITVGSVSLLLVIIVATLILFLTIMYITLRRRNKSRSNRRNQTGKSNNYSEMKTLASFNDCNNKIEQYINNGTIPGRSNVGGVKHFSRPIVPSPFLNYDCNQQLYNTRHSNVYDNYDDIFAEDDI